MARKDEKSGGDRVAEDMPSPVDPGWVDEVLLAGPAEQPCLFFDAPITRDALRRLVAGRQAELAAAGLGRGGSVALCMPPSLADRHYFPERPRTPGKDSGAAGAS